MSEDFESCFSPFYKGRGPWRWFDESMMDYCEPLEKVKAKGISFGKVVCLTKSDALYRYLKVKVSWGCHVTKKRQVTIPHEFHFAIDERIPPPTANVAYLLDKLSLCSDSHNQKPILRKTAPNPFHLHTDERGAEKEKRFVMEIIHKQIEEERVRIPKATPYPYTTDYHVSCRFLQNQSRNNAQNQKRFS